MQMLILNGSPRPNGDTAALIGALRANLTGDVVQIDCYCAHISPCVDCRRCARLPGCAIEDDMQALYPIIESCDGLVIATPVYFSLPTPPLLAVASRLQTYFCARAFRGESPTLRPKRGGILLAGGGSGSAAPAEQTARRLLRAMNACEIGPVVASLRTDEIPASEDARAMADAQILADFLKKTR